MPAPVDILISASAFAQAEVLTSHRKVVIIVTTKSYKKKYSLKDLKEIVSTQENKADCQLR